MMQVSTHHAVPRAILLTSTHAPPDAISEACTMAVTLLTDMSGFVLTILSHRRWKRWKRCSTHYILARLFIFRSRREILLQARSSGSDGLHMVAPVGSRACEISLVCPACKGCNHGGGRLTICASLGGAATSPHVRPYKDLQRNSFVGSISPFHCSSPIFSSMTFQFWPKPINTVHFGCNDFA